MNRSRGHLRWAASAVCALAFACGSEQKETGPVDLVEAMRGGAWVAFHGMAYEAPPPEGESIFFHLRDDRDGGASCPTLLHGPEDDRLVVIRGAVASSSPGVYRLVPTKGLSPGEGVLQVIESVDSHAVRQLYAVTGTVTVGSPEEDGSVALALEAEVATKAEVECVYEGSGPDVPLCTCTDEEGRAFECEGVGCCMEGADRVPFRLSTRSARCPGLCAYTYDELRHYCTGD